MFPNQYNVCDSIPLCSILCELNPHSGTLKLKWKILVEPGPGFVTYAESCHKERLAKFDAPAADLDSLDYLHYLLAKREDGLFTTLGRKS